jgi:hypothetical protein
MASEDVQQRSWASSLQAHGSDPVGRLHDEGMRFLETSFELGQDFRCAKGATYTNAI